MGNFHKVSVKSDCIQAILSILERCRNSICKNGSYL